MPARGELEGLWVRLVSISLVDEPRPINVATRYRVNDESEREVLSNIKGQVFLPFQEAAY